MQLGERVMCKSQYPLQEKKPSEALLLFQSMDDDDACEDADLITVAHYLRGCRCLEIPEEWRQVLPKKL